MGKEILQTFTMIIFILVLGSLAYKIDKLNQPEYDPQLKIAFIGTADESDCIVLWQKDLAIMIDTAEERDRDTILNFLKENEIETLNYLVLTHPDKDHIGSAASITKVLNVNCVIQPFYQKENDLNDFLQTTLAQNQVKIIIPSRMLHYCINDIDIYIYPPLEKRYQEDSNYSLAVFVKHKGVSMLFPGDAENKRIGELMQKEWSTVDLYKLPNHGHLYDNSKGLFNLIKPTYAVVTGKQGDQLMLDFDADFEVEWFFTVNRTTEFVSDGIKVIPIS